MNTSMFTSYSRTTIGTSTMSTIATLTMPRRRPVSRTRIDTRTSHCVIAIHIILTSIIAMDTER